MEWRETQKRGDCKSWMRDWKRLNWRLERTALEVSAVLRVAAISVYSSATGTNTNQLPCLRHACSMATAAPHNHLFSLKKKTETQREPEHIQDRAQGVRKTEVAQEGKELESFF
ncbi:unnamed protein product [Pleuronectes platessa]|uniref:Uncharacterized protein n=1 Tax=Pleuronectes platessa TaxID=8262 RepID=A0A9N7UDR1_PLEPL|nr:unnamed protein product [Pleuronectes platessa]